MAIEFPRSIGPKFVKKIMPWVEMFWHNKQRYPTDGELAKRFGWTAEQIEILHCSKFYEDCLKARGITRSSESLDARQVAAISMITNFSDTRSTDVKLAAIGVSPEELNGWYSNPFFKNELAARADATLENIYPEAQAQLARQIKKGSFPALKFYYEITGRAQSPETVNIKLAMIRMLEAVQKHVKDPEVIAAISREMTGAVAPASEPTVKELYVGHLHNELQSEEASNQ